MDNATVIHDTTLDAASLGATRLAAVVLFNDLVESTPLLVRIGDEAYVELLERLDAARFDLAERHGGRVVSLAGDGALLLFDATDDAIAFARSFNRVCTSIGVESRTGVHLGDVQLRRSGQVAGLTVHAAARIESTAPAGRVLVSATAATNSSVSFRRWGWAELKGIPGATELMEVID